MGGFMLYDGDQQRGILSADKLQSLLDSNAIEFPKITKEEIMDRSKGDYLAKTIIVFQTSWFIVQCIARVARHLALTEIELVTMAFPFLNWVMYFFWWDKPVDVQCSVPVFLKSSQEKGLQVDEIISQPIDPNSLLDNTGHIRSFYSNEAQAFSRHSIPESSTLARTQLCMNDDVRRAEQCVMIGPLSVVMICSRSGLATPLSSEITSGSAADSEKNERNPCRKAA